MACSFCPGSLVKGLLRRKRSYASGLFGCVAGPLVSAAGAQGRQQALAHALQQLLGQRDHVGGRCRRRVPPDDAISLGVDDLHRYAEPVALFLELAREDARRVELAARGLRVDVFSGVSPGGREGTHREAGGVGQRRGDLVGKSEAQVVDLAVSQDVLERKNGNHRLGRRGGRGTAATHHSPDEPGREEDGDYRPPPSSRRAGTGRRTAPPRERGRSRPIPSPA